MRPTTIGLDLAKNVFQVHAVTADGTVVFRRKLRRSELREFFTSPNNRRAWSGWKHAQALTTGLGS